MRAPPRKPSGTAAALSKAQVLANTNLSAFTELDDKEVFAQAAAKKPGDTTADTEDTRMLLQDLNFANDGQQADELGAKIEALEDTN